MALTVTPGGASDDSMLSLAEFEAHCTAFGHTVSGTDEAKEQSIRRMTLWVEGFGSRSNTRMWAWPGQRATATQARVFPRVNAFRPDGTAIDDETIPNEIKQAIAEAVVYDLANPGKLQATYNPYKSMLTMEKISGIERRFAGTDGGHSHSDTRLIIGVVSDILSGVLVPELKGTRAKILGVGEVNWE